MPTTPAAPEVPGTAPLPRPLRVFLSYGHDEFAALAERLKHDLEQRGHQVWFDRERLRPGEVWERSIEEGLDWTAAEPGRGFVVLLMTPHAVRRPGGFCLNEVAYALGQRRRTSRPTCRASPAASPTGPRHSPRRRSAATEPRAPVTSRRRPPR